MSVVMHNAATGELVVTATADGWGEGWAVLADPAPADIETALYRVESGVLVADLPAARAVQRAIINAARDAAQDGGCDVPGVGRFDSSERARQFLNGAAVAAQIAMAQGQPFSIDWTLASNAVVTLDGPGIIAAGLAVAAHVDAMHHRARVLKARIDAATSTAAIAAVVWSLED